MNEKWTCRCEARRNRGEFCQLCMGRRCWNTTYEFNGKIYNLVEATMLWPTGSYDGPLEGIAVYKGLACHAVSHTFMRDRSFWLYPLRPSEWDAELINHARWRRATISKVPKWWSYVAKMDRDGYRKREPLGFFRLHDRGKPIGNQLIDQWDEKHLCSELFKEVTP